LKVGPKVSVITPAYNADGEIADTIRSVLAQNCGCTWEWIIVDDGSTDGTGKILHSLDDPRIRVLRQPNAGVSAARNAGLAAARGEYVTFLDADDRLPPDALENRASFLQAHPEIDIVNGGVQVTSNGHELRRYHPDLAEGPLLERLARIEEGVFFGPFYMLRRTSIGSHEFPVGVSHCEDLIFFLTLAHDKGLRYGAVADTVYEYRVRPGSAMSSLAGLETGYLEFLRRSRKLARIDAETREHQRRRVRRILFRSWLRRGRPIRALSALTKLRESVQDRT